MFTISKTEMKSHSSDEDEQLPDGLRLVSNEDAVVMVLLEHPSTFTAYLTDDETAWLPIVLYEWLCDNVGNDGFDILAGQISNWKPGLSIAAVRIPNDKHRMLFMMRFG